MILNDILDFLAGNYRGHKIATARDQIYKAGVRIYGQDIAAWKEFCYGKDKKLWPK